MHTLGGCLDKEVMQARQNMSLYNSIHYPGYGCGQSTLPVSSMNGLQTHTIKQEPKFTDSMRWPSSHSVSDLLASGHSPSGIGQRQPTSSPNHMSQAGVNQSSVHHSTADSTNFPLSTSVYPSAYFMMQYFQQHHHHPSGAFPASMVTNSANPNM